MSTEIRIPELSLVLMIGVSGSGKSTLARRLFKPTEVLSSDTCRGWVSDDENSLDATKDAFEVLRFVAAKRLARGLLTVVDATNLHREDRKKFVELSKEFHALPCAIVVNTPEQICLRRNEQRLDRAFGPHVIRNQTELLRRGLNGLKTEGFRRISSLEDEAECSEAVLVREPLWNNLKHETGPFDLVGDIHGCYDELVELLASLGYTVSQRAGEPEGDCDVSVPAGSTPRKLVFLGDLVDRGPKTPSVLRLVMKLVKEGAALCVPGNHDVKLVRALNGRQVKTEHGLAESLLQLGAQPPEFRKACVEFIDELVSHYVLDAGKLVVAHAGMKESMQGRGSGAVREFALYGETTGESDEFGLPVRFDWASEYRGSAAVVYGHTPVLEPQWLNNTVCIDTGCVFGGSLTALRWPERTFCKVPARATYATPGRPLKGFSNGGSPTLALQQQHDALLDLEDVSGKRQIETRLMRTVTVREGNAAAAMEIMSRFAADPRWLVYLPPTMSPCETSREAGLLEHPSEAFEYYRTNGVTQVICEEKHMGSRAVVILCRDATVARRRFGIDDATAAGASSEPGAGGPVQGLIYTRTGRPFFADRTVEEALLQRLAQAASAAGLWEELSTDWMCLDCELMPWSAKAQALIKDQYAAVGAAAATGLRATVSSLERCATRLPEATPLLERQRERLGLAERYRAAYRRYCWDVRDVGDLRIAPFHLLATEGKVHADKDHRWHMETLARLARPGDPVIMATTFTQVDLSDAASEAAATDWWTQLTGSGGEGMVVKPLDFIAMGPRGVLQPAIKVRGQEYLRIIYGAEYSLPEHLERLRSRALGAKRALALREFALGIEALERFVKREPLRKVHECAFAILAMESEPVDPRL